MKTDGVPGTVPACAVLGDDDGTMEFRIEAASIDGVEYPAATVTLALPHMFVVYAAAEHLLRRLGNDK